MWWLFLWVGLSAAGLAVLGALAVRVFLAVEALGRQVAVSGEALTAAGERLTRAAGPVAERTGEISRR
jgi:hypothetical protein